MDKKFVSLIDFHNDTFHAIEQATTSEEISAAYSQLQDFNAFYGEMDPASVERLSSKFGEKLSAMIEDQEALYQTLYKKVNDINSKEYDFSDENDLVKPEQVQAKMLQLMAKLPSAKTPANAGVIANTISKTINSGILGSRAVLELLKYPAYAEMIDSTAKEKAVRGSKSVGQRAFEQYREAELKQAQKALAASFSQGYRLRLLNKRFTRNNKPAVFGK